MSKNPYFLPEIDPKNYALKLLADTVGTDEIPIDVFAIPEFLDEYGITLEFSKAKFTDSTEYGVTELSSHGTKCIYINADFYGNSFDDVKQDKVKRRHCRFTLAHELGHCTIPTQKEYELQHDLLDKHNIHAKKYSFTREYEASVFAAELLIPSSTIQNIYEYGKTFKEIITNISEKYDASITASALKTASLMKDSICICLMINPLENKIIKYEYSQAFADYKKGLYLDYNSAIYKGSMTSSLIKRGDQGYNYQKYKTPSDWFPNFYGSEEAELHEWAFYVGENIITYLELIDTSDYKLYI